MFPGSKRNPTGHLIRVHIVALAPAFLSPIYERKPELITITRRMARRLRAVFRRSVLGINHKGEIPPLVLHAENQCLRAQYRYHDLAVEYVEPAGVRHLDSILVPRSELSSLWFTYQIPFLIKEH
jgi:hypothetical protein